MSLIPPMDDEPPPEYVHFVATYLGDLRTETTRLVGGDERGGAIYLDVLADVAGHWRRLCWWGRMAHADAAHAYLLRRVRARTRQWCEDQVYEVDVRVVRQPAPVPAGAARASIALRKAEVLPGTRRAGLSALADAGISWVHAYRRSRWRRRGLSLGGGLLLLGALVQYLSWVSTLYE